ncbi:hypothetical protein HZA86_01900 [Candidatus Uhrbacteria bacterium]|nr:hypothetical protein [Candidatus Uhrbacteria bacterium]
MFEQSPLDSFITGQPTPEEVLEHGRIAVEPLVQKLDAIRRMEEVYKGGQYYFVLVKDIEGYGRWQEKFKTSGEEYQRIWHEIQEKFMRVTGHPYGDAQRAPEEKTPASDYSLFDDQGKPSSDRIDAEIDRMRFELHSAILLDWGLVTKRGAATGKLRAGVKTPEAFLSEMRTFRSEIMNADSSNRPERYKGAQADRAGAMDEVYGFQRTARGFGLAALEAGDYRIAGQAIEFSRRIGGFPKAEEERIARLLKKATPMARAQFAEGMKTAGSVAQ